MEYGHSWSVDRGLQGKGYRRPEETTDTREIYGKSSYSNRNHLPMQSTYDDNGYRESYQQQGYRRPEETTNTREIFGNYTSNDNQDNYNARSSYSNRNRSPRPSAYDDNSYGASYQQQSYRRPEETTGTGEIYGNFTSTDNQDNYPARSSNSNKKHSPRQSAYDDNGYGESYQQQRKFQKKRKEKRDKRKANSMQIVKSSVSAGDNDNCSGNSGNNVNNVINITNIANYQYDHSAQHNTWDDSTAPIKHNTWYDQSLGTKSNTSSTAGRHLEETREDYRDRTYGGHSIYLKAMEGDNDSQKTYNTVEQPQGSFVDTQRYGEMYQTDIYNTQTGINEQKMATSSAYNPYGFSILSGLNSGYLLPISGRNIQGSVPLGISTSAEYTLPSHNNLSLNNLQPDVHSTKPLLQPLPPHCDYGLYSGGMQDTIYSNKPISSQTYIQDSTGAEYNTTAHYNYEGIQLLNIYNSHMYDGHSVDNQHSVTNLDHEYPQQQKQDEQVAIDEHIQSIYNESLKEKNEKSKVKAKQIDTSAVDEHIKNLYESTLKEKERDKSIYEHIQNIYNATLNEKKSVNDDCIVSSMVESTTT